MPATFRALTAHGPFQLRVIVPSATPDEPVEWAHGSDLDDPTPFLSAGQLLLTTGRQFAEASSDQFEQYVARLRVTGVIALGFGAEVVRDGTPSELVSACRSQGLALFEVPYRTPFIAISRWIADAQAADARARLDWALDAQRAVSLATLGNGGLASAVARTAERLGCAVAVFDPGAEPVLSSGSAMSAAHFADMLPQVERLLRARRRARLDVDENDHVVLQTLGSNQHLRGVLVARRAQPFDRTDLSVLTTLFALAEVSLEQGQVVRAGLRALAEQFFELLLDGQIDTVRRASAALPMSLPGERFRAVVIADDATDLADQLERRAFVSGSELLLVRREPHLVLLVDERRWSTVKRMLESRDGRAGVSEAAGWSGLRAALAQAERALPAAGDHGIREFGALSSSGLLDLLRGTPATALLARARLDVLHGRPDARELVAQAAVWLRHNGQWEPAARELGLHRHTLKSRMASLGAALGLDLDEFADRAELWALLAAAPPA
jgi:purine catabolism regulator